jgi:hypothetical protein
MRNWVRTPLITLRNSAILAAIYSVLILSIVYFLPNIKPWHDAFKLMNAPLFYIGLGCAVILGILYSLLFKKPDAKIKQLGHRITLYIQFGIPIIILLLGLFTVMLSYTESLWQNLPYDLNAFGVGVTMTALGFAFLFAAPWSRFRKSDSKPLTPEMLKKLEGDVSSLSTKIETLNKKLEKAEKTIDAFLEGSQKLGKRLTEIQKGKE